MNTHSIDQPVLTLVFGTAVLIFFSGCAGVTVTPLNPDAVTKAAHAEDGVRYYMPMPYLMVVEMPPFVGSNSPGQSPNSGSTSASESVVTNPKDNSGTPVKPDAPTTKDTADSGSSSPSSATPISDTSFMAATPQYMVKLIYLPDLRRPMAMTQSTGLFGTSQMQPVLQDGWMLTSLNANADSKVSETLTALAAIAGAAVGTSSTGGASKGTNKSASSIQMLMPPSGDHILRPGLYRFSYDDKGLLTGLDPIVFFSSKKGTTRPSHQ
jgi:hypothetical protein